MRMCVDYRAIHLKMRNDAFPLPLVHEYLNAVPGANLFSSLDLSCGYHLAMKPEDKEKIAFCTHFCL